MRFFHEFFYENGYNTLSRETGLVPMIYYNGQKTFVKREGELPFNLLTEIRIIIEEFGSKKPDVIIFENNAIRSEYMRSLSDYLHADVVIITTITFDHILSQGFSMEETAETFIKSIPPYSHIIFWSNHEYEYDVFKKSFEKSGRNDADILLSSLDDRESVIYAALKKIIDQKGMKISKDISSEITPATKVCEFVIEETCPSPITHAIPEEVFSYDLQHRVFVDVGHVNDPIHTYLILHQIMAQKKFEKFYLLFNFREDRLERIPLFIEGFLPLIMEHVKGIIIRSDAIAFSPSYLAKYIKNNITGAENLKFYTFNDFNEFLNDVTPQIPEDNYIIMVANTADKFGYELIDKLNLFRESYPILNKINLFELRYSKKPEELY
ncbi:MAG: hypothetical protein HZC47_03035 [Methanobacterium sp.]|uniref:hypothetical protein n=1 Tax=Methanobacterium sp. TaxID=2164 RepID=UPI003D64C50F|nr:hypothetical protein [Methanobacterium sp.]